MIIALDYDGTYTADPDLWDKVVDIMRSGGHRVVCVTMRYPHEKREVEESLRGKVDNIIYTSREAKQQYVFKHCDTVDWPEIWIDDNPHWIYQNSK